jgi:delta24(24(1))-sterol reductase
MVFQLLSAFLLPGKVQTGQSSSAPRFRRARAHAYCLLSAGLPVPSLNYKTLSYRCNALSCFYLTLATSATLHLTGLFDLTQIIDNFGSLMSVGIIVGFTLSFVVYFGAIFFHWGGKPIRMSGNPLYDFFMGGECACLSSP